VRKKVLLLSSRLPYPPIGGDKLKSYNLLKILAKHYDVHLVIVTDEILTTKISAELKKYTKVLKIFTKPKYSFYLNTMKFLLNSLPLQVNYYYFNDVQKYIDTIEKEVDFAIPILIRTSEYLKHFAKPKYLDMVDSIGLNYQKSKNNVKSLLWRIIYSIEIKRLLQYEKKCISNYKNTFFVNKYESEYWSKYGKTTWIPNGVDKKLFKYKNINEEYFDCISFFGKMDYQPNIDAVLWFVKNVFIKMNNNLNFIIVGTKPTKEILDLAKKYKSIKITGFVNDPYEILQSSLCVVAPMQTGGGIQNKILESMALGTINIVSKLGAKPIIGARNNKHFFVTDDPDKILTILNILFQNSDKYIQMKKDSQNIIMNKYTWDSYENIILNSLSEDYL
jgi:glycosyltransferase involved in cell wall biosynthesis